jgi:hypothetical protein
MSVSARGARTALAALATILAGLAACLGMACLGMGFVLLARLSTGLIAAHVIALLRLAALLILLSVLLLVAWLGLIRLT